jgi:AraC family transcriptional activator of tynA and feaB
VRELGEPALAIVYSTSDVHPRDSVPYWVEVVTKGFVKYVLTPTGGPAFRASVRAGSLDCLGVSVYECDPHAMGRSARDISHADNDDVFICLQVSGKSTNLQDDRQATVESGGFFLLDPRRPFAGRCEQRGTMVAISVPRQRLEARTGTVAAFSSRPLDDRSPLAGLAFSFLTKLPGHIEALGGMAASKVAEHALDLAALAFSAGIQPGELTLSSPRTVALTILKTNIEGLLRDEELKPSVAAAAAGMSVRSANALLATEGTSLERYIIQRRLEMCRRALEDVDQASTNISEIAFDWGFSDAAHFSRRFKEQFGCSPSEYRRCSKISGASEDM